jgi:hypothetical protein
LEAAKNNATTIGARATPKFAGRVLRKVCNNAGTRSFFACDIIHLVAAHKWTGKKFFVDELSTLIHSDIPIGRISQEWEGKTGKPWRFQDSLNQNVAKAWM